MIDNYLTRFDRTGRALWASVLRGWWRLRTARAAAWRRRRLIAVEKALFPKGAVICLLDERGTLETSPEFAARLGGWRDHRAQRSLRL